MKEKLVEWAGKLEQCLGSEGFAVGTKLSLADIVLHELFIDYLDDKDGAKKSMEACPKLQKSVDAVAVAAKDYFASRKQTKF